MTDPTNDHASRKAKNKNRFCAVCGLDRPAFPATPDDEFGPCPFGADSAEQAIECRHVREAYLRSRLLHHQLPSDSISGGVTPVDGVHPIIARTITRLGIPQDTLDAWWAAELARHEARDEIDRLWLVEGSWLAGLHAFLDAGPKDERFVALVNHLHFTLVPDTGDGMRIADIYAWQERLAERVSEIITEDHCWETGE